MNQNMSDNEKDNSGNSSSISSDLIRGHINTIILRTLYDGDKYGYEIINEIEEKSKGQYSLKQPTLYSALKRLESQDFVTSYWGGVSNGGRRKYFQITDKGRKIVEQNLAEWEYSRTVIDSLISEKDYDFNNPPPAASVDFNLLKKSTTRVPIMRGDESDDIELDEEFTEDEESFEEPQEPADKPAESIAADAQTDADTATNPSVADTPQAEATEAQNEIVNESVTAEAAASADSVTTENSEQMIRSSYAEQSRSEASYTESPAASASSAPVIPESPIAPKQETPLTEEEKQRIHENYKVLIGEDTDATNYYYTHVAQRNREERSTFDKSVFGNEPQSAYSDQQNIEAYAPQQEMYPRQEATENYYQQDAYAQSQQQPYAENPEAEQYPYPETDANASDLLYANKSPAERNYKSLLSRLYDNTIKPHDEEDMFVAEAAPSNEPPLEDEQAPAYREPATPPPSAPEPPAPRQGNPASSIEFYDVEEKAENDGLRITTTNGTRNRTVAKSVGNTFDKGKALFLSAVYVFIIALAESIVNICLQNVIHSNTAYVVIPFVIDFVMLGVFLFLYLRGYGKNSRKTQSKSYISASLIVFVNLILIICLVAYLISLANENSLSFMIYAIFPCVYMFNIPLFAIFYNYNCNKK